MALEDNAKKRIDYIAKRQELLASAVNSLQASLYESVLKNFDKIADDPAVLNLLWQQFQVSQHAKVLQKFAVDVMQIGKMNAEYFEEIAADLDSKDYAAIKKNANEYLMNRFGLASNGKTVPNGFLDTFVKDQSILRDLKQYAYKAQNSGVGVEEFKQGFKDMIVGTEAKNGSLMRYYQTFAFDTYQQADASIQEFYAKKLELEAALYLGGEISGTRPFCHERNGKVFLRSEIETWRNIKFAGRPANYDPFQDRGGYNCRHHFNWITNKMAVARRSDLEIGEDGKLRIKGTGSQAKPAEKVEIATNPETGEALAFKPAKNLKEAKAQHLELMKKTGLNFDSVSFSSELNLDQYNALAKNLDALVNEYNVAGSWNKTNPVALKYKSSGRIQGVVAATGDVKEVRSVNFGDKFSEDRALDLEPKFATLRRFSRVDEENLHISTQTHEFGHLISFSEHGIYKAFEGTKEAKYWKELREIQSDYFKELAENREKASEFYLGRYAAANIDEFHAEAFTEYKLRANPSKYAKLVGELIDKYFKKQNT